MITFFDTELKLMEEDLSKLEERISFELHKDYRKHLLNYNGGRCEPNVFSFIENGKETESNIDWFLAVYDGEHDNFEEYFNIYKIQNKRMPSEIFPIGHDPGGNLICMNRINGKVYFWNHEEEVNYNVLGDEVQSNLYLIAESLEDFILALKSWD